MHLRLRTVVQILCLLFFISLIFLGGATLTGPLPLDLWLRLDPLVSVFNPITTRTWVPALWGGLAILALTLFLGRFFCGYMCPLGTTFDLGRRCLVSAGKRGRSHVASDEVASNEVASNNEGTRNEFSNRHSWKYGVLIAISIAALCAIPAVFLGSPIAWAMRIFALLLYPLFLLAALFGIHLLGPLSDLLHLEALTYLAPTIPQYALQPLLLVCALMLLGSVLSAPRFWCRYLCPAGALMALFGRKPLLRRRVNADCVQCGKCIRRCPMEAIEASPYRTRHSECITCTTCVQVCPQDAVSFGFDPMVKPSTSSRDHAARRLVLTSGLAGAGYVLLSLTHLGQLHGRKGTGQVVPVRLLRPPGALPEPHFLARCIRCGLCLQVCPTNTLQPLGLAAGVGGLYTPRILPRRGACEPGCAACGAVCPTDALRPLPLDEKQWAKIGTARVIPQRCLAWAQNKACLVCDEVCPYDAIDLRRVDGHAVAVPFVEAHRCSGCGYCEHHCPVQADAAIVVGPLDALRLADGSYRRQGRLLGLQLALKRSTGRVTFEPPAKEEAPLPADTLPPGFSE
ncbi:MAG: 4Fe-4S binding protein [Desulfosarcinaceae bacterium]|jgi:MauM/NapG family ferredoxin protein